MQIKIHDCDVHLTNLRTRMPFKYGIATMTRMPMAFVRARVEVDGKPFTGIAADLLPPKWFTKDPAKPLRDEVLEMLNVIEQAKRLAIGLRGDSAFAVWRQLYEAQRSAGKAENLPPLLTNFGVSLVERALIEAVCRAAGRPFAEMVHANHLGIQLDSIHPSLRGLTPGELLPAIPLGTIIARHTVGLGDPLTDADIPPAERLTDGLPQSHAASIQAYGLRHFKIKINGHLEQDIDRLHRLAALIEQLAPADYAFSLDGNEQFKSLADFHIFWETFRHSDKLQSFLKHLYFVEQPLHRTVALEETVGEDFRKWSARPPVIIDESDATLDSLPIALRLGYVGTSHKNCKGIFKGLANRCLLLHRQQQEPSRRLLMSGEDLCNLGPVALLQDLAVMATLGVTSVERNGHHYCAGLSLFPKAVQEQTLAAHGDLYHRSTDGWPTVNIRDGKIQIASLNVAPFGVGFALDVEQFMPAEKWRSGLV